MSALLLATPWCQGQWYYGRLVLTATVLVTITVSCNDTLLLPESECHDNQVSPLPESEC
jgi:hypothetical protein